MKNLLKYSLDLFLQPGHEELRRILSVAMVYSD